MAARDARRSPGRSLLVVALIALPVFALSAGDVLYRTMQLSPSEQADRDLGRADALVHWRGGGTVKQAPDGQSGESTGAGNTATPAASALIGLLPSGARIITSSQASSSWQSAYGIKTLQLSDLPYQDEAVSGLYTQSDGRAPVRPDEVALTPALARSTGRTIGQTLTEVRSRQVYRVVGIVKDRYRRSTETAFLAPATLTGRSTGPGDVGRSWYVTAPRPISWPDVRRLNTSGYWVASREVILHPPARTEVPLYVEQDQPPQGNRSSAIAIAAVLAGMILLEIILLAGPAFAVGARRARRTLALVAAVGGTRADLRNVVLAGGVVLGVVGGLAGIVIGSALALALLPTAARLGDQVPGHLDFRPLELGATVAVSVVTGLLAAWLPARAAARTDVLAALRGRRGTTRTAKRVPAIGAVATATGAVVAIGGSAATGNLAVLLMGAVIAELGLIACVPAILGLVGRAARWLPLAGRIAVRDTSRNRSAAASAVAAVMAAVTGAVAASIYVATLDAHDRANYEQQLPMNAALIFGRPIPGDDARVARELGRTLPTTSLAKVRGIRMTIDPGVNTFVSVYPRHEGPVGSGSGLPAVMFDDGAGIDAIAGQPVPAARATLRRGDAVVFRPEQLRGGYLELTVTTGTLDGSGPDREVVRRVRGVVVASSYPRGEVILPAGLAATWKLPVEDIGYVATNHREPTDRELQAARAAMSKLGLSTDVYVETGYHGNYDIGLLALLGASALITLGAATIATALATVDSRPDLITLAAIGASPRVRRRLSAARAGVIAFIGCALGVSCGFLAPVGFIGVQNALARRRDGAAADLLPIAVPWWPNLIGALVLVPLLAVAGGFLFSRSRLPMESIRPG